MEPILELKNVCKQYDGFALDHVSFSLPKGCIMGFVGENGAGKSTTIKLILGLIAREEGEISLFGQTDPRKASQLKERIGVVFDECSFPDNFKTGDVERIMRHIYSNWDRSEYTQYISRFSLPQNKPVKDFSRGMKVKLSLAVALSHHAELLLLDEATSGLDPMMRDELLDFFWEFIQDDSHSILISTHIISDLSKAADYITCIHEGRILFSQPKDALLEEYGVLRCRRGELDTVDPAAILGVRHNQFGSEALVRRALMGRTVPLDPTNLEEIMLFSIRGEAK